MARRLGDEPTLLFVLTARHLVGSVADRIPDLVAELPEVLALAERVGDLQSLLLASAWGSMHNLDLGHIEQADRLLERANQIAAEANVPLFRWLVAAYGCSRLMVNGTGDDIEAAAVAALELGEKTGEPDSFVWFAPQLFIARLNQGRIGEILDLTRQQTANNPGIPIWAAALALGLVRAGDQEEAAATVNALMGDGSDPFPYDLTWLLGHSLLGEAVALVGTPEQAAREYELLSPYADRFPCVGNITSHSVALDLATLAARLGRRDDAERHFAAADAAHVRLDAPVWLARTRLEWGRFLLAGGEVDRAHPLLTDARTIAERMGSADVAEAADGLLANRA
jgi:hypothetical protein